MSAPRLPVRDRVLSERTAGIIESVRCDGDDALRRMARELDGVALESIEVPRARQRDALADLDPALRAALERAADRIRTVHKAFRPARRDVSTADGVRLIRRPDPLARAGVYAPGGRAAYPSSVLMCVVPARVAGVREVVLCSPPAPDGLPHRVVMAAAELAGVDRMFAVGGAGAIAAMALGTGSIPRADVIVGPGNAWVAEAKAQLAGLVRVDAPAGPSELLVVADDSADYAAIGRELLAQAEHDPQALARLVTTTPGAASETVIRVRSLEEAVRLAEAWAPEHLLLDCRGSEAIAARVRNCGTVFFGGAPSAVFGDYRTGANHVLPTGGAARAWSGLSTEHFVRWTTTQEISAGAARRMAADTALLARAEGLPAHAAAADAWSAP